jgi:transcriptional regulator with XRE-family HTH domain
MTDYEQIEGDPTRRGGLRKEELLVAATCAVSAEMERQGVTKADMARCLGTTRGNMTQLLAGSRNLTLGKLAEMADALGCKIELRMAPHGPLRRRGLPGGRAALPPIELLLRRWRGHGR